MVQTGSNGSMRVSEKITCGFASDSLVEEVADEMAILRQQTTSSPFQDAIVKSCLTSTNLRALFQVVVAGREKR